MISEDIVGYGRRAGPPSWFVILLGIAIVFGLYYLWIGLRSFMSSGVTVVESTRQAIERSTATANRIVELQYLAPTPLPTYTPVPPCQEFVVIVRSAIVRSSPSTDSRIVEAVKEGETVCVIAKQPNSEWYVLDKNTLTRRLEPVYMHEDIIRALYPTDTPTRTPTATPSDTPTASFTPSDTSTASPTLQQATRAQQVIAPVPTRTPTAASINL
ncbi:MAG: SH3 domain-containing protein [Chloroflexi bacterium]|nr:SH3 domain-containing protein [Chloroflexota bacterium]